MARAPISNLLPRTGAYSMSHLWFPSWYFYLPWCYHCQPWGIIFQTAEANSGWTVALLRKSHASQRVKCMILQYESRILQLLQGHPEIPAIYGYSQLPHFEYIVMASLSFVGSHSYHDRKQELQSDSQDYLYAQPHKILSFSRVSIWLHFLQNYFCWQTATMALSALWTT